MAIIIHIVQQNEDPRMQAVLNMRFSGCLMTYGSFDMIWIPDSESGLCGFIWVEWYNNNQENT